MVASLLYFGHALETTRQSVARSVYFRRRLRGAALLGAAPHLALSPFPVGDTITGNQISSGYYGISNSFRHGQHIIENTIAVTPPTTDTAVGINLLQCPFTRVSCNNINGGGTGDTNSFGIVYNAPDTGSQMLYNTLSVLGTGFIANNTKRVRLINNAFENSMIGINVNGSHATIGNQGNTDTTYDNVWEGPFFTSMILTSNGAEDSITDIFYVRSDSMTDPISGLIAIYDPPVTENNHISFANPMQIQVVDSAKQYLPNFLTTSICTPPPNIQLRMPYFGNNSGPPAQDTTTTNQSPQLSYKLIPNLYRDNFTAFIKLGTDEQGSVQIYNIDGILMGTHIVGPGTNELNLSGDGLQPGVYLYKVFVNGQIKTNDKLVVVH